MLKTWGSQFLDRPGLFTYALMLFVSEPLRRNGNRDWLSSVFRYSQPYLLVDPMRLGSTFGGTVAFLDAPSCGLSCFACSPILLLASFSTWL
jgi:hypothetical protein